MTLRFHNTLSRTLEPFEPREPGRVRVYTCGPTVYDRAHIGNFRTFVWEDLLRRYLKFRGYEVEQVMNLTDVDDRTIGAAAERGTSLAEVTEPVIEHFHEDWDTLGLERVEHNPRATEHVPQMVEVVRKLEENGYTYEADGSVYFAIDRLPGYGRLVNLDPAELGRTERVEGDEEYTKENPRDFVLWKGGDRDVEGEVATWDSPWGPGRPGWHLECSAMAIEYLGPELDIHTGGVDNIFPHHTNEMAQSEAATEAALCAILAARRALTGRRRQNVQVARQLLHDSEPAGTWASTIGHPLSTAQRALSEAAQLHSGRARQRRARPGPAGGVSAAAGGPERRRGRRRDRRIDWST